MAMSLAAQKNWRLDPPNFPYTIPKAAIDVPRECFQGLSIGVEESELAAEAGKTEEPDRCVKKSAVKQLSAVDIENAFFVPSALKKPGQLVTRSGTFQLDARSEEFVPAFLDQRTSFDTSDMPLQHGQQAQEKETLDTSLEPYPYMGREQECPAYGDQDRAINKNCWGGQFVGPALVTAPLRQATPGNMTSASSSPISTPPTSLTPPTSQPSLAQHHSLHNSLPSAHRQFAAVDMAVNPAHGHVGVPLPVADPVHFTGGNLLSYPHAMPFDNGGRYSLPPIWSVLKISNIPYAVTRQEVTHLLGRGAKVVGREHGGGIHIIMERSTAKTMDCYVEFESTADAESAFAWVNRGLLSGHSPRLGSRHVQVEMSSQDALLRDLFPRAKGITWKGGAPHIVPNTDAYSTGFQGFFTSEEIYGVVRHAEVPQRSPFCANCPQRTYECMISTLWKFPWYAGKMYTVEDRNQLFSATFRLLRALVPQVEEKKTVGIDGRLASELLAAGLKCPTFNERQKYILNSVAKNFNPITMFPDTSRYWAFDTLSRKPHATDAHLKYYAELISLGAERKPPGNAQLANGWVENSHGGSPYGKVWLEYSWGNTHYNWQDAVEYEAGFLKTLVVEGLKAKYSQPAYTIPALPAPSVTPTPTVVHNTNGNGNGIMRVPVHTAHGMRNRVSTSIIEGFGGSRGSSEAGTPRANPRPSNSFSIQNPLVGMSGSPRRYGGMNPNHQRRMTAHGMPYSFHEYDERNDHDGHSM